jgi:hypothetical protein
MSVMRKITTNTLVTLLLAAAETLFISPVASAGASENNSLVTGNSTAM